MPTLLAQCANSLADCDLPHTLPWYFGVAIGAAWLTAVAGVVVLFRRRWMSRRGARSSRDRRRRELEPARGTDVEIW